MLKRKLMRWRMFAWRFGTSSGCLFAITLLCLLLTYLNFNKSNNPRIWQQIQDRGKIQNTQRPDSPLRRRVSVSQHLENCEILSLPSKARPTSSENTTLARCQRIPPAPGSCATAKKLFFSDIPATCSHQKVWNICNLQRSADTDTKWTVVCSEEASKICVSPLSVGTVDQQTGSVKWELIGTPSQVTEKLSDLIHSSSKLRHYGFSFIRCKIEFQIPNSVSEVLFGRDYYNDDYNKDYEEIQYAEQLLVLPPQTDILHKQSKSPPKDVINLNIILVDSVSRQHFFRSLKKSVAALEKIGTTRSRSVLDFELVQAVRSRTFETLQTIFSGDIDPSEKPFGTQDIPPEPLKLSALLSKFKLKGYHTLWLEDLCYLWEWGISKDLHFLNKSSSSKETWVRMWKTLTECQVDDISVTLAMCRVLEANGVADHFHGPDAVCFNGRHQHEYIFEYLTLYQQAMDSVSEPFITFTMTNVGHEDTGRRVQTLDETLAGYLTFSSSLPNTLTIVFSDHGNAYGSFIAATQEARIELFHPFMFLIVPNKVTNSLGHEAFESLQINTQRLVSFLDLHYTLNHIISPNPSTSIQHGQFKVSSKGLFEPIDISRTCDDIPRIMPNLCICQDYDIPTGNNTYHNLFAYFALGRLNDEIQRQLITSHSKIGNTGQNLAAFQNCERLMLFNVKNMRQSFNKDRSQIFKMDLHVQQGEIFFVAVSVQYNSQGPNYQIVELEMYDRITPYSKFSTCADYIDLSLCICNTKRPQNHSYSSVNIPTMKDFAKMSLLPEFDVVTQDLQSGGNCVKLVTFKHVNGAVMFAANTCKFKSFSIRGSLEADDDIVFFSPPQEFVIISGGMMLLGLIHKEGDGDWTCSVKVECRGLSVM